MQDEPEIKLNPPLRKSGTPDAPKPGTPAAAPNDSGAPAGKSMTDDEILNLLREKKEEWDPGENDASRHMLLKKLILPGCLILLALPILIVPILNRVMKPASGTRSTPKAAKAAPNPVAAKFTSLLTKAVETEQRRIMEEAKEEEPPAPPARPVQLAQGNAPMREPATVGHAPENAEKTSMNQAEFARLLKKNPDNAVLKTALDYFYQFAPDDFTLHGHIVREMIQAQKIDFAKNAYADWVKRSDTLAGNMILGLVFAEGDEAIPYLKRACGLAVNLPEPFLRLAELYESSRNWKEAADTYRSMLRLMPNHDAGRTRLCEVRIRSGENAEKVYQELQSHYQSFQIPGSERAKKLLPTAQMFLGEQVSAKLLEELQKDPDAFDDYCYYAILHALIFRGKAPGAVLKSSHSGRTRGAQMLYHISNMEFASALLMPTPPEDFPEFWKVFCAWYKDDPLWKNNARKLLEKSRAEQNAKEELAALLWLGEIPPEQFMQHFKRVPEREEPLMLFLLAEQYRKQQKTINAEIRYKKLMTRNLWIYTQLIHQYKPQEK